MRRIPDAVFLDRDGTLIEDAHYIKSPQEVRLLDLFDKLVGQDVG